MRSFIDEQTQHASLNTNLPTCSTCSFRLSIFDEISKLVLLILTKFASALAWTAWRLCFFDLVLLRYWECSASLIVEPTFSRARWSPTSIQVLVTGSFLTKPPSGLWLRTAITISDTIADFWIFVLAPEYFCKYRPTNFRKRTLPGWLKQDFPDRVMRQEHCYLAVWWMVELDDDAHGVARLSASESWKQHTFATYHIKLWWLEVSSQLSFSWIVHNGMMFCTFQWSPFAPFHCNAIVWNNTKHPTGLLRDQILWLLE